MRLIDADAVLAALAIFHRHDNDEDRIRHFMNGIETAIEIIEDAPDADAVPIKPLSRFLTSYLYPPGMQDKIRANLVFMSTQDGAKIIAECWENFLKKKRWDDEAN